MKEETKCYCGHTTYCDCGPETLEEVTDRLFDTDKMFVHKIFFMRGAEWQQQRSYSEEEVIKFGQWLSEFNNLDNESEYVIKELLKQFKKK